MKILVATDHAGFELKNTLVAYLKEELGLEVTDCGAHTYDPADDYPDYIAPLAKTISKEPTRYKGIIIGASGQGEAMQANRYPNVRAAVYYGDCSLNQTETEGQVLDMVKATRDHNDANVLSLAARYIDSTQAKVAVKEWLATSFSNEERHIRRIKKMEHNESN